MTKDKIITASYLMVSLGLFVLAIETWICGTQPFCRENNRLVSSIANADIIMNVPEEFNGWSGSRNPNFQINLTGSQSSIRIPSVIQNSDGDGGDGH